ncbi:MAG: metalloenzyme [Chloroflexales bacterium]|nr:metalloenzyme [Chloroflexales bacterium]
MPIIFVFLDGVGLAPTGPTNPLAVNPTPHLRALLGGPLTTEQARARPGLLLRPIDAALGVPGPPQSGTGHVALLAGINAPALHGRHQPNFPPVALRPLLAERSLFRRALAAGHSVAFANVFPPLFFEAVARRRIRPSASVLAAQAAGLPLRGLDELRAGQALSWDITGHALHARDEALDVPLIDPQQAGARLAALAHTHGLVFFECFMTDLAGHGRLGAQGPADAIARVDGLIGGLLDGMAPADTLLITSDHGNLEDGATTIHSEAPVPLLVVGPNALAFATVERIDQVADAVLGVL